MRRRVAAGSRWLRAAFAAGVLSLGTLGARTAHADTTASAEALFEQGRVALAAKDYPRACAKLGASLALERAVGTYISLAVCEEAMGELARARAHWKEGADFADSVHDKLQRGPYCRKKLAEIDPRVPRLAIKLATSAPKDTTVALDGAPIALAALDEPLPVDPGPHTIVSEATGRSSGRVQVEAVEGKSLSIDVAPGPLLEIASGSRPEPGPATSDGWGGSLPRTGGIVAGAAGVVGLGLGVVFGIEYLSKASEARHDCPASGCAAGSPARSEAATAGTYGLVSTVGFVAGAVLATGGALLFFVAPKHASHPSAFWQVVPVLGPGTQGVWIERRF
jgi:hypothetical protein